MWSILLAFVIGFGIVTAHAYPYLQFLLGIPFCLAVTWNDWKDWVFEQEEQEIADAIKDKEAKGIQDDDYVNILTTDYRDK